MKKFTKIAYGGGVSILSIILALSLTLASCNNNSNSGSSNSSNSNDNSNSKNDNANPSPSLPANVGENPIEKAIKLTDENSRGNYLELRTDGTALYFDGKHEHGDGPLYEFKYTYDADAKKIYMRLEKLAYYDELLTYDENLALIDKEGSVAAIKEWIKEEYDDWGKEEFDSYEDFEKNWYEKDGFDSLEAWSEYSKQGEKAYYKAGFGAQVTYSYKIDGGKMMLTENFTGVKNMFNSSCKYNDSSNETRCSISIYCNKARFDEYNYDKVVYYHGIPDTDENTIAFRKQDDGSIVNATYTENISAETVTINFNDKDYICKFEGEKFIQE